MTFQEYVATEQARVDACLDGLLPAAECPPSDLHTAVRYMVFGGGKRIRPVIANTVCRALGGDADTCLPCAAAIELIHVSSLIHDDLPCMDDADTRRGQPSCHIAFSESTAVLVGDWLLVYPFRVIAREAAEGRLAPEVAARVSLLLAAGVCDEGIVAGQVEDLAAETRRITAEELDRIHLRKTAALIEASAGVGAAVAMADPESTRAVLRYARGLGLCFQAVDDILDVVGDAEDLGKPTGADAENEKATHVGFYGLQDAKRRAARLAEEAHAALRAVPEGPARGRLHELVDYIVGRGM